MRRVLVVASLLAAAPRPARADIPPEPETTGTADGSTGPATTGSVTTGDGTTGSSTTGSSTTGSTDPITTGAATTADATTAGVAATEPGGTAASEGADTGDTMPPVFEPCGCRSAGEGAWGLLALLGLRRRRRA